MTLQGHKNYVRSAGYSPDGERIVTASDDGTAKVWDASSGRLLKTLEGHTDLVFSAAYSPNGSRIVTAGWDNTAKVWDASSLSVSSALTTKPKASGSSMTQTLTDGPFGLKMGMSLEEILKIDPSLKKITNNDVYSIKNPPIPNSLFGSYFLTVTPKAGLCKIGGAGAAINSNNFGDQIKEAFNDTESILNSKYGQGNKYDYLKSESKSKNDDDWMVSLYRKDRVFNEFWLKSNTPTLPFNVESIKLEAGAVDSSIGYLLVSYEFLNINSCLSEIENSKKRDYSARD